eukprot:Nk52_evm47s252 gene=Nk52_evmTU47s252
MVLVTNHELGERGVAACDEAMEFLSGEKKSRRVDMRDFELLSVIGKGGFAKVFLVRKKTGEDKGHLYAMKVMKKNLILRDRKITEHTKAERHILQEVNHPFIVRLQYAFQTEDKLYLILDYMKGGELFSHIQDMGIMDEEDARIYIAEIVLALEHLHSMGIIYRDLKLENLLLDENGHVSLTDFGLSKEKFKDDSLRTNSFAGTAEYMAPEIITQRGHGKEVDWWSLGILIFELLTGSTPFYAESEDGTNSPKDILFRVVQSPPHIPDFLSNEAANLIKQLLEKSPKDRLGSGPEGVDNIKNHPFFKGLCWEDVLAKRVVPPIIPVLSHEGDTRNFDTDFTDLPPIDSPLPPEPNLSQGMKPGLFRGFSFVAPPTNRENADEQRELDQSFERAFDTTMTNTLKEYVSEKVSEEELLKRYMISKDPPINLKHRTFVNAFRYSRVQLTAMLKLPFNEHSMQEAEVSYLCRERNDFLNLIETLACGDYIYLFYEMVKGERLSKCVGKRITDEKSLAQLAFQLCSSLAFLHEKNVFLGKLDLDSLIYSPTEDSFQVVIADFSFARVLNKESLSKRNALFAEDLSEFGVVLYFLCRSLKDIPLRKQGTGPAHDQGTKQSRFLLMEDFLNGLINQSSAHDFTARQALQHPWFRILTDSQTLQKAFLHTSSKGSTVPMLPLNTNFKLNNSVRTSSIFKRRKMSGV